jgi:hypothetical protein
MFNNLSYSFDQLILSSSSFSVSYLPICQLLFPVHSYFGVFVSAIPFSLLFSNSLSSSIFLSQTPIYSLPLLYSLSMRYCLAILTTYFYANSLFSSCSHSLSSAPTYSNFYMTLFSSYLVLPLYSTISFYVLSFDVIHSFGYHSFGFKSDAIPGRVNSVAALSLFVPGFYSSYCYELCGSSYTSMLSSTIVLG